MNNNKCIKGHFTDKEHDGKKCPYDDMSASELASALAIDTEQKDRERFQEIMSGKNIVYIDRESYAKLCSAVRTKYANKIPKRAGIFIGKNYYRFKYKKFAEQILCTFVIRIEGNEDLIREIEGAK